MTKFRILTTDGEWVYSQVNVLEDRIACPLLNAQGAQFLKPNIKFRPETLGYSTTLFITYPGNDGLKEQELFDKDIIKDEYGRAHLIKWKDGMWVAHFGECDDNLSGMIEDEDFDPLYLIGNIHENPELLEEKA